MATIAAKFSQLKVKVKTTLRPTVSQSVCLGVEPNLGLMTRDYFFSPKLLSYLFGAPSLTRGRVCYLSVFVITVYNSQSVFTSIIYNKYLHYLNNYILCYTHLHCNAIFTIYTRPLSVKARYSRLCPSYQ
jgi:hypothetical protein